MTFVCVSVCVREETQTKERLSFQFMEMVLRNLGRNDFLFPRKMDWENAIPDLSMRV